MFFYLNYRQNTGAPGINIRVIDTPDLSQPEEQTLYLYAGAQRLVTLALPDGRRLLLLGDPVFSRQQPHDDIPYSAVFTSKPDAPAPLFSLNALYEQVRGHYYWFLLGNNTFRCGASFGAIYPVYHKQENGQAFLGSSAFFLAGQTDPGEPDNRYLLERLLFNYAFFDATWWTKIRLLPAHHSIRITQRAAEIEKDFSISDYFGTGWRNSGDDLAELAATFEAECRLFLPETPFAVSFTGGFDGRTLVAAARAAGRRDFFTYSFGMPAESDLSFPAAQAKELGIEYLPIRLDETYVQGHALDAALGFLRETEYFGNLGRPHYHYAARVLAGKTACILTGNFGSELFRAMHQPGVMMSEVLIRVFSAGDASWKDALRKAVGAQAGARFHRELDALIADLETYLDQSPDKDPNRRFYRFVLEEIFRKYFGPELVMQSGRLRNRTPYLSLPFFRALNETVWSGVHARLFEKQKNKRLKGQLFYAAFLRRTDTQLYRLLTNKGYSPADVLETWRRPLLLARVARHKVFRKETGDSNAVEAYFTRYRHELVNVRSVAADAILEQSGLARALHEVPAGDLEKSIHLYTLAAGWTAASKTIKQYSSPIQSV